MTRARTASYGVVTPPPLDRWIEAVLMLCVSLVQGAATTLGMIFNRNHRDWHTETAHDDLPQAKHGISSQGTNSNQGVMLGLVPSISVGPTRGFATDPCEAVNRDARHKGEHDIVDVAPGRMEACPLARVPGGGRGPVLREAQTATSRAPTAHSLARRIIDPATPYRASLLLA